MVIKMFSAFPAAPQTSKLLALAVYLDTCGYGPFMPKEMRDALQQCKALNFRAQDPSDLAA
jgi:hypothetical protein